MNLNNNFSINNPIIAKRLIGALVFVGLGWGIYALWPKGSPVSTQPAEVLETSVQEISDDQIEGYRNRNGGEIVDNTQVQITQGQSIVLSTLDPNSVAPIELKIRIGPGEDFGHLTTLPKDTNIFISDQTHDGWSWIKYSEIDPPSGLRLTKHGWALLSAASSAQ